MKKLGVLIFTLVNLIFWSSNVQAQILPNTNSGKTVVLPQDQTIDGDYFISGDTVEILGTVNGDLYAAGGQVIISGIIVGDVLAAGGQISLSGKVGQDARFAGGVIQIEGDIGRNLTIAAGNTNLSTSATVTGNTVITGGNISIAAPVGGDLMLAAGLVTLANQVQGNLHGVVGKLRLAADAVVSGNVIYVSQEEISVSELASISGTLEHRQPPAVDSANQFESVTKTVTQSATSLNSILRLIFLINQIIIGLVLIRYYPNLTARINDYIENSPVRSFGYGLVVVLVSPILLIFLCLTILGIPLAIMCSLILLLLMSSAQIVFIFWLGNRFLMGLKRTAVKPIIFLVGAGIYFLLTSIHLIGPITVFLSTIFGTGSIVLAMYRVYSSGRKLKIF
jgi:hypothetical protein